MSDHPHDHPHEHVEDPMLVWADDMDGTYESTIHRHRSDSMLGTLTVSEMGGDVLHVETVWLGRLNEETAEFHHMRWTYRVEEVVDHPELRLR